MDPIVLAAIVVLSFCVYVASASFVFTLAQRRKGWLVEFNGPLATVWPTLPVVLLFRALAAGSYALGVRTADALERRRSPLPRAVARRRDS